MPSNLIQRGGVWYARLYAGGRERRISLRTGDLKEARKRLKGAKTQFERSRFGIEPEATWQAAVIAYSAGVLDAGGLRPGTAKRYRVSLRQLDGYFPGMALAQITATEISRYVASRQKAGVSNATVRRDLVTLSRVLAYAKHQGYVLTNAADDVERGQIKERREPIQAPDDAAIEAAAVAVEALVPGMGDLLRFLRANGLRAGEALRATWGDVHGETLTIHETKSGRARTIQVQAVPPGCAGRLFPTLPHDTGALAGKWAWARRKLELPHFRLHDLRHAYAIAEIRTGRDIYDLSRHMGHSSVKVTEGYLAYRSTGPSTGSPMREKPAQLSRAVSKFADPGGGDGI